MKKVIGVFEMEKAVEIMQEFFLGEATIADDVVYEALHAVLESLEYFVSDGECRPMYCLLYRTGDSWIMSETYDKQAAIKEHATHVMNHGIQNAKFLMTAWHEDLKIDITVSMKGAQRETFAVPVVAEGEDELCE